MKIKLGLQISDISLNPTFLLLSETSAVRVYDRGQGSSVGLDWITAAAANRASYSSCLGTEPDGE